VLKVAHDGTLRIPNVRGSPSASLTAGVNEYGVPTWTASVGAPLIVGAELPDGGVLCVAASSLPPPHAAANEARTIKNEKRVVRAATFTCNTP
jgi:hypothetical protein